VDLRLDESSWPIVVGHWDGRPSDAALMAALARLVALLARGERFALIVDTRGGGVLTPEQRRLIVSHMQQNAERNAKYLVQAVVATSVITKTLYWGVQLLSPPPFPSKVFAGMEAARAWVADELGSATQRS
jgi:hypothetical protein